MAYVKQEFPPPAPPGLYNAVCVDVVELGMCPGYQGKGMVPKERIYWESDAVDKLGRRYIFSRMINVGSLGKRSALYAIASRWRGKDLSMDECKAGFDTKDWIGQQATLSITNSEDGEWANVDSVMPGQEGREVEQSEYSRDVDNTVDVSFPDPEGI